MSVILIKVNDLKCETFYFPGEGVFIKNGGDYIMRNYEKPVVLANNEMSEGVYAASGDTCWVLGEPRTEAGTKPESICFYIEAHHNTTEGHGNEPITVTLVFNKAVSVVSCNSGTYELSGSVVKITSANGLVANQNEKWEPSVEVEAVDGSSPNSITVVSKNLSLA